MFLVSKITQITLEVEISEIEEPLEVTLTFKVVNPIKRALDLLSDRKSPYHRNSIKESISDIEAICKLIVKDERVTLSESSRTQKSGIKI